MCKNGTLWSWAVHSLYGCILQPGSLILVPDQISLAFTSLLTLSLIPFVCLCCFFVLAACSSLISNTQNPCFQHGSSEMCQPNVISSRNSRFSDTLTISCLALCFVMHLFHFPYSIIRFLSIRLVLIFVPLKMVWKWTGLVQIPVDQGTSARNHTRAEYTCNHILPQLQGPREIPVAWQKTLVSALKKLLRGGVAQFHKKQTRALKGTSRRPNPEAGILTLKTSQALNLGDVHYKQQDSINQNRVQGSRDNRKENKVGAVEFGKKIETWSQKDWGSEEVTGPKAKDRNNTQDQS